MRTGGSLGWRTVGATDYVGVRGRRRLSAFDHPLDVVACDWRYSHWPGRLDFPAGLGRRVRHHRWTASRERDDTRDSWNIAREMVHLGGVARFWHIGWRSGAAIDDGWCTRWSRSNVSS